MPLLEEAYIDTGQVRYFFRHPFIHDDATQTAVESLYCAGEQDAFWEMHDWAFFNTSQWIYATDTIGTLAAQAEAMGLDGAAMRICLEEGRHRDLVQELSADARARGVTATPTFLVNDQLIVGFRPFEEWVTIIEEELQQ